MKVWIVTPSGGIDFAHLTTSITGEEMVRSKGRGTSGGTDFAHLTTSTTGEEMVRSKNVLQAIPPLICT